MSKVGCAYGWTSGIWFLLWGRPPGAREVATGRWRLPHERSGATWHAVVDGVQRKNREWCAGERRLAGYGSGFVVASHGWRVAEKHLCAIWSSRQRTGAAEIGPLGGSTARCHLLRRHGVKEASTSRFSGGYARLLLATPGGGMCGWRFWFFLRIKFVSGSEFTVRVLKG